MMFYSSTAQNKALPLSPLEISISHKAGKIKHLADMTLGEYQDIIAMKEEAARRMEEAARRMEEREFAYADYFAHVGAIF